MKHENGPRERGYLRAEHEPGKPIPRDPEDDAVADEGDDVASSSQGLGAVYGDADRTPHPGPVKLPGPEDQARMDAVAEEYEIETNEDGERYLAPRDGDAESPATTDEYPDSSPS